MIYTLLRPALFALEPERAHRLTLNALQAAAVLPGCALPGTPVELMGLRFANRVGLAAGFDKNGDAINGLARLGFGFVEIGTVTPRPQPGQAQPRVFRLVQSNALINRMGFPSAGAHAVVAQLKHHRYPGMVGINIGKNADTPLANALDDYLAAMRIVHEVADYLAVNISSPNTQALRDLHRPEQLEPLLTGLLQEREQLCLGRNRPLPLLLKISPDLDQASLEAAAQIAKQAGIDGIIATNTTITRPPELRDAPDLVNQTGGLSGAPLYPAALRVVTRLRQLVGPQFPIIGVGGIDSAAKAQAMRAAGADLIQFYTGLIYRGPALVGDCVRTLP